MYWNLSTLTISRLLPEVTRRVMVYVQKVVDQNYLWQENNVSWTEHSQAPLPHVTPTEPYLISLYRNQTKYLPHYNAAVATGGLDPETKVYPAKIGEIVEIVHHGVGAHT
jgi:L-ascorbate oxidase